MYFWVTAVINRRYSWKYFSDSSVASHWCITTSSVIRVMAGERPNVNQTVVQKPSCKQTLFRTILLTEQLTKHGMGPYRDLLSYCHLAYCQGSEQESCSGKSGMGRREGSRSVYQVYLARLSFVAGGLQGWPLKEDTRS